MQENINLKEASKLLGISEATVKNWVKNKTISYSTNNLFSLEEILNLKSNLESENSTRLKSRRNKSKIKGIKLSKNYTLDKDLYNFAYSIFNSIDKVLTDNEIKLILCEYSLKLIYLNLNIENKKIDIENTIFLNNLNLFDTTLATYKASLSLIEGIDNIDELILLNKKSLKIKIKKTKEDFIGLLYMGLRTLRKRKEAGIYYTPRKVVNKMLEKIKERKIENKTLSVW